jgi:hypothetical protein
MVCGVTMEMVPALREQVLRLVSGRDELSSLGWGLS